MFKKAFLRIGILLFFFTIYTSAFASTNVGGTITSDTTWNLAGSPYVLTTSVTIDTGVVLTVDPGVIIKIGQYGTITSRGDFVVNGTSSNKVIITSVNDHSIGGSTGTGTPGIGDWDYITVQSAGVLHIDHAIVRYGGRNPGTIRMGGNSVLKNSLIELSERGNGVNYQGAYTAGDLGVIQNNTIHNMDGYGISYYGGTAAAGVNISGNTLTDNTGGIIMRGATQHTISVTNNTITNNAGYGIDSSYNKIDTFTGNTITGNDSLGYFYNFDPFFGTGGNTLTGNTSQLGRVRSFTLYTTSGTLDTSITNEFSTGGGTIAVGKTLTIPEGVIFKLGLNISILVSGTLNVNGTSGSKVEITSVNDHSVGSTTGTGLPVEGSWDHISTNAGGKIIMDHVNMRYGGRNTGGMLKVRGDSIVENSRFEFSKWDGISYQGQNNVGETVTIRDNIITNISGVGNYGIGIIYQGGFNVGSAIIENNTITQANIGVKFSSYSDDAITLNNNTITNNTSYGIYSKDEKIDIFTNNTISNNAKLGYFHNLEPLLNLGGNTLTGNSSQLGEVLYFTIDSTNVTLNTSVANEYTFTASSSIPSGSTLTIPAGVIIKVGQNASINVLGTLDVNGTAGNKVEITSVNDHSVGTTTGTGTPNIGSWDYVSTATGGKIEMDHVNMRYGGRNTGGVLKVRGDSIVENSRFEFSKWDGISYQGQNNIGETVIMRDNIITNISGIGNYGIGIIYQGGFNVGSAIIENNTITQANIGIKFSSYSDDAITLNNNTITNNTSYGIYSKDEKIDIFTNNTVSNNAKLGFFNNLEPLLNLGGNTLTGNTSQLGEVQKFEIDSTTATLNTSVSNEYMVVGTSTLQSTQSLTIPAGVIIKVGNNLTYNVNGTLTTNGTSAQRVTFTSMHDNSVGSNISTQTVSKGKWDNIRFVNSASSSVLNYTDIKYAGRNTYAVYLYQSDISMNHVIVTNSDNNGISVYDSSGAVLVNVTSANNDLSGIIMFNSAGAVVKNSILYNNGAYGIQNNTSNATATYNLFFNNTSGTSDQALGATNITGQNPLFVDEIEYKLDTGSPAINAGDPSMGNHPVSGDLYDMGAQEKLGFFSKNIVASISGVTGRSLSYTWSIVSQPNIATNPASLSVTSGSISSDGSIDTTITLKRTGSYTLRINFIENGTSAGTGDFTFTITQ